MFVAQFDKKVEQVLLMFWWPWPISKVKGGFENNAGDTIFDLNSAKHLLYLFTVSVCLQVSERSWNAFPAVHSWCPMNKRGTCPTCLTISPRPSSRQQGERVWSPSAAQTIWLRRRWMHRSCRACWRRSWLGLYQTDWSMMMTTVLRGEKCAQCFCVRGSESDHQRVHLKEIVDVWAYHVELVICLLCVGPSLS